MDSGLVGLLGTMQSQKQVIEEQTFLQCLESPLVTIRPLFDFLHSNKKGGEDEQRLERTLV